MDSTFFKNKRVTVFGLGLHGGGIGTVKFLVAHGSQVTVTDIKSREELLPSLEKLKGLKNITYVLGQHRREDFINCDMVVKTPPIPWDNEYIKLALEKNIPVEVDSSLFFQLTLCPIVGITGTKGKTTTASMIYEIFKYAGKKPIKVGIGQESVMDKIAEVKKNSTPVFELSSWRLSALGRKKISPHVAVFTNLHPDHLNYYKTMEGYLRDKTFIFKFQKPTDWLVFNGDDEAVCLAVTDAPGRKLCFSSDLKDGLGEVNVYRQNGDFFLKDEKGASLVIKQEELMVRGAHNGHNVLAAIGAAYAMGVSLTNIRKSLMAFKGISHRLEFVRELKGVEYYNDTAATIPHAAIKGITSFSKPIILIAGGSDKNLDFTEMGQVIADHVKGLILFKGKASEKICEAVRAALPGVINSNPFPMVETMEKAVELAYRSAEPGEVVLLSPGAASFGLFQNEFDRGEKFRNAVKSLI